MTWVKANTTCFVRWALWSTCASRSSFGYPLIFIVWRSEIPRTRTHQSASRVICTCSSTIIRTRLGWADICWLHRNSNMNSIDDLNIIKINIIFGKSHFGLSCRLTKTSWWYTRSITIISTICCRTVWSSTITALFTCDSSTPYHIVAFVDGNNYTGYSFFV